MYILSIIIPIYKVENYIQECVFSLLSGLPPNVEIICVNDGTPDNSIAILENIINEQSEIIQNQFKIIHQENQGLSVARNTGIKNASGEYIGFIDSDDKITPDYFESLLKHIDKKQFDIIDFNIVTSKGRLIRTRKDNFDSVFTLSNWFCPARVFKRELFKGQLFIPNIYYEDIALTPKLYLKANRTYHINKTLYWYRSHTESLSRAVDNQSNLKTFESLEYIANDYYTLYSGTKNPYYALTALQTYFLLATRAYDRLGFRKSFYYVNKYKKNVNSINLKTLNLDITCLNTRVRIFNKVPGLYHLSRKSYTHFKNFKKNFK